MVWFRCGGVARKSESSCSRGTFEQGKVGMNSERK